MKNYFFLLLLIISFKAAPAQFTRASLKASGLTCSMCSKAVKEALEKVDFVQDIKVDIKSQEYNLSFRQDLKPDFDALSKAVEDAGFSVASLKVTGNFSDVKVDKDAHTQIGGLNIHFLNSSAGSMNGEKTVTVADKNFLSAKEFKKHSAVSKHPCLLTGKAGSCCTKEGIAAEARVYHVVI